MAKRLLLGILIIIFQSNHGYSQKYKNPTGTQFPIVAWYALDKEHNRPQDYEMMAEAGFNLSLSFFSSYKDVITGLEACEGTGVKLITYCWEQRNKVEYFIPKVKNNKNLAYYYISDEPTQLEFKDVKTRISQIKKIDRKHPCYVNLQPNYATLEQLKSSSYENYIENYLIELNPSMISFDYYPFHYTGFREGYYGNIAFISSICKEKDIPFWGFVMSATNKQYPKTNKAYLKFQVAINLAFGAKGIQYFTYSKPNNNYKSAIVDNNFQKTEIFDIIKDINNDIQYFSKIWLNSNIKHVWYVGHNPPNGLSISYNLESVNKISTKGKGFVLSYFRSNRNNYIVAVNTDLENKQELFIDSKRKITKCEKNNKKKFKIESFIVNPGDYILIRL